MYSTRPSPNHKPARMGHENSFRQLMAQSPGTVERIFHWFKAHLSLCFLHICKDHAPHPTTEPLGGGNPSETSPVVSPQQKKLPDKLYFCTGVKVSRDFQSQEQTLQLRFSPSSYFTQNKSKDLHSFGRNYRLCWGLQTSTVGTSIFSSTFSLPPWSSPSRTCCCSEAFAVGHCHFCSIIHSPKSLLHSLKT